MATTPIHGSNGACRLGASNNHDAIFNTWSANFTRTVHDVTGFADTGRRRVLGIADITGSAGGFMEFNDSNSSPSAFQNTHASGDVAAEFLLTVATGCTYTFHAVMDTVSISSTAGGDATITMNFQMAGGTDKQGLASAGGSTAIEAWDETN